MFWSVYSSFSLSVLQFMLLFNCISTLMNGLFQREDETNNVIGTSTSWGGEKTGRAHSFPPLKCFNPSIYLSVLWIMLLFHCIFTLMNDLFQREYQVFNPTRLLVLLHCWVGKDWAGPFFPPSKMLGSFYLSSRLLDYVILLLYLNSLDLYQAENQVFKPTRLFVIVGWGKTGPAHCFPPP